MCVRATSLLILGQQERVYTLFPSRLDDHSESTLRPCAPTNLGIGFIPRIHHQDPMSFDAKMTPSVSGANGEHLLIKATWLDIPTACGYFDREMLRL